MSFDLSTCSGVGLFVWRIEKLDVKMITDSASIGNFYSGTSPGFSPAARLQVLQTRRNPV